MNPNSEQQEITRVLQLSVTYKDLISKMLKSTLPPHSSNHWTSVYWGASRVLPENLADASFSNSEQKIFYKYRCFKD